MLKTVFRLLQISLALVAECDRALSTRRGPLCLLKGSDRKADQKKWVKVSGQDWVSPMGRQGSPQRDSSIVLGDIIRLPQRHFPRLCLWIGLYCTVMSAFPGKYHCYTAVSCSQLQCEHQLQVRPLPYNVWLTNITDFMSKWRETDLVCSRSKHLWNDLG